MTAGGYVIRYRELTFVVRSGIYIYGEVKMTRKVKKTEVPFYLKINI